MRTLVLEPPPAAFEQLLKRRRQTGADRRDEVWDGVLHMAPAPQNAHGDIQQQLAELIGPLARANGLVPIVGGEFNVGDSDDYRVPDGGLLRERRATTWNPTAALVIEIISPGDETWAKLDFYANHHVDELLIIDPQQRQVDWRSLTNDGYQPITHSTLIELNAGQLTAQIDWPPAHA